MTISALLHLLAYACVTGFSPGPNNILMLSVSSRFGFKKCLPTMAGIWTGSLSIMIVCGLFCSTLMNWIPGVRYVLRYAGAAYILYLAWKTLQRKPSEDGSDFCPGYFAALLLQYLNVKIILYGITAFTGFILPYENRPVFLIGYAVILMMAGAGGNLLWAFAGSSLRQFYNSHYRLINLIMALLLVWCAYKMVL